MSKISIIRDAAEKAMAAETERTGQLLGRAEKLVAGIIVVTGFQLLAISRLLYPPSHWAKATCYASLAALVLSLAVALCGLRLNGNAGYPRGDKLWENLKGDDVSDEAAESGVIQLLLKNREQNARLNDAKARLLSWCGSLFFVAILLVIASHLLATLANAYSTEIL